MVPLFVGAIGKAADDVSLYDRRLFVFGPLVLGAAYGLMQVGGWFEDKRRMFRECNVYQLENTLFDRLRRGKNPEPPLDYACTGLAIIVALLGVGILVGDIYQLSTLSFLLVVLTAILISAVTAQLALRGRVYE